MGCSHRGLFLGPVRQGLFQVPTGRPRSLSVRRRPFRIWRKGVWEPYQHYGYPPLSSETETGLGMPQSLTKYRRLETSGQDLPQTGDLDTSLSFPLLTQKLIKNPLFQEGPYPLFHINFTGN